MNKIIVSTAYLPPLLYIKSLICAQSIIIEQFDSYHKQTFRNRCRVVAANGPLDLSVPVVKKSGEKTMVKDIEIDYSTTWQTNHWRTLLSAYNSSPFFEYYSDDYYLFYHKRIKYLIDLNMKLLETISSQLELTFPVELSSDYLKSYPETDDLREYFSPKKQETGLLPTYTQTFSEKFGFIDNLSIVDLLFNLGPEARSYLLRY